ncbi:spore cortex biosynthesis protein YabQ [Paenibacillus caui]|uniref:spore cortex biosynthesis protein YabQ n=1 Tax=Paenibacillus caui TaxID=2873927 RepID=UPI001CA952B8|nr:spore cortex biosynthesis protein YabQ [Paenibacillus caui]
MSLQVQWITLLWMLASGSVLGVVYDSMRIIEGRYRFPRWSIHGLDLLYWLWAALFVFRTLYHSNEGEIRFYVFLGLFVGVWIYFLFLSVITGRFVVMLLKVVDKICFASVRLFQVLIIGPLRLALKAAKLLLGFFWAVLLFLLRLLLPVWKLLKFLLLPLIRRLKLPEGWQWVKAKVQAVRSWFTKE